MKNNLISTEENQYNSPSQESDELLTSHEEELIKNDSDYIEEIALKRRMHAINSNGDTPLHIAARVGNLYACDLFICSGADPKSRNNKGQTPSDIAIEECNCPATQYFFSVIQEFVPSEINTRPGKISKEKNDADIEEVNTSFSSQLAPDRPLGDSLDIDGLLNFEPEPAPDKYFAGSSKSSASGTFTPLLSKSVDRQTDEVSDWDLDISVGTITGDAICGSKPANSDPDSDYDFLKARKGARRSAKRRVVQSGTRLSIDPLTLKSFLLNVFSKGGFGQDDIQSLISTSAGNTNSKELRTNLIRNLEAMGLEFLNEYCPERDMIWDTKSDVKFEEVEEAILAVFSKETQLPGTQRFDVDNLKERRLLKQLSRAKQELLIAILARKPAIENLLKLIDSYCVENADLSVITMRAVVNQSQEHPETNAFFSATESLRTWQNDGRVMDGKRRRKALQALEALDLTLMFHKKLVRYLSEDTSSQDVSRELDSLISTFEAAVERLILDHLPYARRFAARNVEDGEDPEDVFQIAFMGLQRSTRRFDPERGNRFVTYSTFWMRQALARWRADEGALIRIPVHRHQKLAELDSALETLNATLRREPTAAEIADKLGWDVENVKMFLQIPRQYNDMSSFDEWPGAILQPEQEDLLDQAGTLKLASEALAQIQERQAEIIRMRFGIEGDEEMTLEEIGQIYGVTRERIRQIEAKGLRKLLRPDSKRRTQKRVGN